MEVYRYDCEIPRRCYRIHCCADKRPSIELSLKIGTSKEVAQLLVWLKGDAANGDVNCKRL